MMIPERPALERRVLEALDVNATGNGPVGGRIPVVLGGCGTGRSSLLLRLRDLLGRNAAQYVDVERIATTPERFLNALRESSPFPSHASAVGGDDHGPRESFTAALAFLSQARGSTGGPVTFLLDEFLELRTFESFPGPARGAPRSDYRARCQPEPVRADHALRGAGAPAAARCAGPLRDPAGHPSERCRGPRHAAYRHRRPRRSDDEDHAKDDLARLVHALSDGRPSYARMIAEAATALGPRGAADPVSALCALLAPGAPLAAACRYSYELRLHRARGYGALKAILEVLADQEPLTLTEIALRLRRTPGSTKDYLSWLEDVDLITSRQKRYSFSDPLLRVWVRLHCRATPPSDEDIAREVHTYVLGRLPQTEPALALAGARRAGPEKSWGIIEID